LYTQQFDVHGTRSCSWPSAYDCGDSGMRYGITNNAFQYTNGLSFKLRGSPRLNAFVSGNTFASPTVSDAVATSVPWIDGLLIGPNNMAGYDSFGKYQVCDFDRDSHDDLFLATGASWWYKSGAKQHWVFLNSSTVRPEYLAVGDFEGTGRCDVFTVDSNNDWLISRDGNTGWQSLGIHGIPFDQLRFGHFTDPHRMDIFRRDPNGVWSLVSLGTHESTTIGSSSLPLSELHFGSFNGNGLTDVIANIGGHWSMSVGGRSAWQPLNQQLSDSLDRTLIADMEGKGVDDILRYNNGTWQVSVAGRNPWQTLANIPFPYMGGGAFVGHFQGRRAAELLVLSVPEPLSSVFQVDARRSQIFSRATGRFLAYNQYAY
jgi:hypothetical protein